MDKTLTVIPAYGRDYNSKKAVMEDWNANKDFLAVGMNGNGYINKAQVGDLKKDGFTGIHFRYKKQAQIHVLKLA